MRKISPYKKRKLSKVLQPYIIGGLMIVLVFALAFVLIISSSKATIPADAATSVKNSSSIPSSEKGESESEDSSAQSEVKPESEELKSKPEIPKSNSSGNAFSPEEIQKLDELILKYETISIPLSSTLPKEERKKLEELKGKSSQKTSSEQTSSEPMMDIKSNVSIYYEDLTTGDVFYNNEEYKYFIASLIKAPYSMYLYTLAEQGKCDLDEKLTIEYKDIQEGTGKIKSMEKELFPLKLSVRELISYAIRSSDNTAMETLRKKYNHVGYLEYAKSLGLNNPQDVLQIVNGQINAKDCGIYIKAIYSYIETGKYGDELKEDMENTTNPLILSKYPVVRKYGWADGSFHDMAVVYSPNPYLLVILTDKAMGTKADYKFMYEVSNLIGSFHQKKYKYD